MKIDVAELIKDGTILELSDILDLVTDDDVLSLIDDESIAEYAIANGDAAPIDQDPEIPSAAYRALAEGDLTRCAELLQDQFPDLGSFRHEQKIAQTLFNT